MEKIFRITVKRNINSNGEHLSAGANVEVITKSGSPFSSTDTKEKIKNAFANKYGVDMEKIKHHINSGIMDANEL